MPKGDTGQLDAQKMLWLAIIAGNVKLHEGDTNNITREIVDAAIDPYRAFDEKEHKKRHFHVAGHAEEIVERIDSRMENLHDDIKSFIRRHAADLSSQSFEKTADQLGNLYVHLLGKTITTPQRSNHVEEERIILADTDHAALWHDTVYHTDKTLPQSSQKLLTSRLLKREGKNYVWTEEGKKSFSHQLFEKIDVDGKEGFLGAYPAQPLGMKYNELLSAVMAESAILACGITDPQHIIQQVAVITNTIPFRSPDYQKHFERSVEELATANPGPGHIVKSGKLFTNLADVAAFGVEMSASNLDVLVGIGQLDREDIPALRDTATLTGTQKAAIGRSVFFNKFIANGIKTGTREIFRGDGNPGSEFTTLHKTGHENAIKQLEAACMLEDARVVAGFLTDGILHEAGVSTPVPQAALVMPHQDIQLHNCSCGVADATSMDSDKRAMAGIVMGVLSAPHNTIQLNRVKVEYGMPGDEYASELIKSVGPKKISEMADKIYRVLAHRKDGVSSVQRLDDTRDALMNSYENLLGTEEFSALKKSIADNMHTAVARGDTVLHDVATKLADYEPHIHAHRRQVESAPISARRR